MLPPAAMRWGGTSFTCVLFFLVCGRPPLPLLGRWFFFPRSRRGFSTTVTPLPPSSKFSHRAFETWAVSRTSAVVSEPRITWDAAHAKSFKLAALTFFRKRNKVCFMFYFARSLPPRAASFDWRAFREATGVSIRPSVAAASSGAGKSDELGRPRLHRRRGPLRIPRPHFSGDQL